MTQPLISLTDVKFAYRSAPVLAHINLDVLPGDYVGVIGPNGGGKTTLLKLMLGLLHPSQGEVRLFGKTQADFKERWRIGYVAQHVATQETKIPMTVEEVVSLGRVSRAGLFSFLNAKDRHAVQAAMRKVDIYALRKRVVTELSGGQQQRVFIAKALAAEPEVLILDEPTVGIDIASQDAFYQLLAKLNKEDKLTLIMVSHDIDVVVNEVTKVACINQTLMYHGAPKKFVDGDYMGKLYGKARRFILHGH